MIICFLASPVFAPLLLNNGRKWLLWTIALHAIVLLSWETLILLSIVSHSIFFFIFLSHDILNAAMTSPIFEWTNIRYNVQEVSFKYIIVFEYLLFLTYGIDIEVSLCTCLFMILHGKNWKLIICYFLRILLTLKKITLMWIIININYNNK